MYYIVRHLNSNNSRNSLLLKLLNLLIRLFKHHSFSIKIATCQLAILLLMLRTDTDTFLSSCTLPNKSLPLQPYCSNISYVIRMLFLCYSYVNRLITPTHHLVLTPFYWTQ